MRTIFYLSVLFCLALIFIGHHPEILEKQGAIGNPLFSSDETSQVDFPAILGAIVVFFFYVMKFGRWPGPEGAPPGFRPKPTRHFTTWLRYMGWACIYGSTMLIFYLLIIFFPKLFIDSLSATMNLGTFTQHSGLFQKLILGLKENPGNLVPYAVIIVTVIWSGVFAVRERFFRQSLQESAMIPTQANQLIEKYESDPDAFCPEENSIKKIIVKIPYHLISRESFSADNKDRLEKGFAQCEYMLSKIFELRTKKIFAKTFARYQEDLEEAKLAIHMLSDNLQQHKREMLQAMKPNESVPDTKTQTLGRVSRDWENAHSPKEFEKEYFIRNREELEKEMSDCLNAILRIAVCASLAISRSTRQRNALLKKLGLAAPKVQIAVLSWEYISRAGWIVLLVTLLSTGIYHLTDYFYTIPDGTQSGTVPFPSDTGKIMVWCLYSVAMNILGIFGGFSVQKWLTEERRQFDFSKPHRLNISDYSTCFLFGFSLNVFLFAALLLPSGGFEKFQYAWPWALPGSVSACFTGFYMVRVKDAQTVEKKYEADPGTEKNAPRAKQINRGYMLLQGGAMALVSISVMIWHHGFEFLLQLGESKTLEVFGIYLVASSFLVGSGLSYILQDWINTEENGNAVEPTLDQAKEA